MRTSVHRLMHNERPREGAPRARGLPISQLRNHKVSIIKSIIKTRENSVKTPRPHHAVLVAVLVLLPALTTACGMGGRDGAAPDQAALLKALSSVAAPEGLTPLSEAELACELNLDCGDIGSSITYSQDLGHLKACTAAVALQGKVPAGMVRWTGSPAGATAVPTPAVMIAACVKALSVDPAPAGSPGQEFTMRSDLLPGAVPVKSATAVLTVEDPFDDTTAVEITLSYGGPGLYSETK